MGDQSRCTRYNSREVFGILRDPCEPGLQPVITLYGIDNCDTVKRARKWLESRDIDYQFHDLREDGVDHAQITAWLQELGWENLLNRRSKAWQSLDEQVRRNMDDTTAAQAVLEKPTLIKRPLLDTGRERHVGFTTTHYEKVFNVHTL